MYLRCRRYWLVTVLGVSDGVWRLGSGSRQRQGQGRRRRRRGGGRGIMNVISLLLRGIDGILRCGFFRQPRFPSAIVILHQIITSFTASHSISAHCLHWRSFATELELSSSLYPPLCKFLGLQTSLCFCGNWMNRRPVFGGAEVGWEWFGMGTGLWRFWDWFWIGFSTQVEWCVCFFATFRQLVML